jgi:hypothetical protein
MESGRQRFGSPHQDRRDGSGWLFIIEQPGDIRIFKNGHLSDPPLLDTRTRVNSGNSECGLLKIAFHPKYKDYSNTFAKKG